MKRIAFTIAALLLATSAFAQNETRTINGSITAAATGCQAANCVELVLPPGASSAVVQLSGTFVATVQFEASPDDGTTWNAISGALSSSGILASSATGTGVWQFQIGGYLRFRVRGSAYTSGTVSTWINASTGGSNVSGPGTGVVTSFPDNEPFNLAQVAGATVATGSGTAAGAIRVELPTNGTGTLGLNTGSNLIGQTVPAATASTTNTALPHYLAAAATTNATSVKASAGNIYGIDLENTTSTIYYLRLYDLATAPTCSSATGFIKTIPIPHGSGAGGGIVIPKPYGMGFATGIAYCVTGGPSSTDNTAAATGVFISIDYK